MTYNELYELIEQSNEMAGYELSLQIIEDLMSDMSGNELYSYYDKNGLLRTRDLKSQLELISRSISGMIYSDLMEEEAELIGTDLVLFSAHVDCSKMCRNDQGNIASISGKSKIYKSKADAITDGFYHYGHYGNCRHCESPYVEGFTQVPDEWGKWTNDQMDAAYKKQQTMRYNERKIRKYKKQGKDDLVKKWSKKPHDKYRVI